MLGKTKGVKTNYGSFRKGTVPERIQAYLLSPLTAAEDYGEDLARYLASQDLPTFFHNLHEHLLTSMIVSERKNTILPDGVYILLQGTLTYVWVQHRYDRDRKEHLLAMAKNNAFSNLIEDPYVEQPQLNSGYSLALSRPFSVVECEMGNIMTSEDCIFLKLDERTLEFTAFQRLKEERNNMLAKCSFSNHAGFYSESILAINSSLHHTLRNRSISFHNKFQIKSVGVVVSGMVSLKLASGKKVELTKYSMLLPGLDYEVSSAEAVILEVSDNPTVCFNPAKEVLKFVKQNEGAGLEKMYIRIPTCQKVDLSPMQFYRTKISNSVSMHKKAFNHVSDAKKRKREVTTVSRQCENYCIIPMEYCRENLKYAKNINKTNMPKEEKLRNPNVLFNLTKRNCTNDNAISPFTLYREHQATFKIQSKPELMSRYENFSKELYSKFISSKGKKENLAPDRSQLSDGNEQRTGRKRVIKLQ